MLPVHESGAREPLYQLRADQWIWPSVEEGRRVQQIRQSSTSLSGQATSRGTGEANGGTGVKHN